MKITILIIWLWKGGMTDVVFQSPEACKSALAVAKAEDRLVDGVCVPQGRE